MATDIAEIADPYVAPKAVQKVFAGIPKQSVLVGNSDLAGIDAPHNIPERLHPKTKDVLRSLLAPTQEKLAAQHPVRLFGVEHVIPIAQNIALDRDPVQLNIGMSASDRIAPMLPSYLELGIQRIRALLQHSQQVRLRVFSTASLSPSINSANPEHVQSVQEAQQYVLQQYIDAFYLDLAAHIDLSDICQQIPLFPEEEKQRRLEQIRSSVSGDILKALEDCGAHHGGASGKHNALLYAAYHPVASCFQDEGNSQHAVSIGGPGEALFNDVRFADALGIEKSRLGVVLTGGVVSRTPPYLHRDGNIEMQEFLDSESERMRALLENPCHKKHRHRIQGAREMAHIAQCLDPDAPQSGLIKLRDFYKQHISYFFPSSLS